MVFFRPNLNKIFAPRNKKIKAFRLMKKAIILIGLSICITTQILAQTGAVKGKIWQSDSTTSIAGVTVFLESMPQITSSNGSGYFELKDVPTGKYTLITSNIGHLTEKKQIEIKPDATTEISLYLKEAISMLTPVTVMTGGDVGIQEIPGSVYYLSPKEIEKFSYTDVNRTLRTVPGVNLQEEDGFGLRPNIGLRGTGVERSSKITVMEDGILMAPAPYAAPAAYYFPTIGRMQAVEILKGSSQIKYGPYTTGGAINLISSQIPNEFSGKINLLGGSFGGRNLHAVVGNSHKNFAYMVETFQHGSDGFKELDGGGNTGFNKQDYLAKFRLNTDSDARFYQTLTFKIGQATETSDQTYLGLSQADFDTNPYRLYAGSQMDQMNTEQTQYALSHIIKFSKNLQINTSVYRSDFKRNWYKLDKVRDTAGNAVGISSILDNPSEYAELFDVVRGGTSINDDALYVKANNRSYYAQGVQTNIDYTFKTGKLTHNLNLGVRVHQDQIDRFQWADEYAMNNGVMQLTNAGEAGTESNRVETADALAAFLQYQLKIKKFTITPGLRYENIKIAREDYGKNDPNRTGSDLKERSNQVEVFIPGVGIDYRFNKYLSSFAGVHKGFSPPGSTEGALPEESINYELGSRYRKNAFNGQLVLFFNDYSNLLGADLAAAGGSGSTDLFNGGAVETKGIEFQFGYDLLASFAESKFALPLNLSYTYTDAKFRNSFESAFDGWGDVEAGDEFPYLAHHQLAIVLGLQHAKFGLNISGRYMDEMRTSPGQGEIIDTEKTDAYFILDASANYQLHKNFQLFANATNLTNQVYVVSRRPAGLRPGMPFAFNLGIKARF